MQDFDLGALDETQFQQAPLDLGGRQAVGALGDVDRQNSPAESAPCQSQWQG